QAHVDPGHDGRYGSHDGLVAGGRGLHGAVADDDMRQTPLLQPREGHQHTGVGVGIRGIARAREWQRKHDAERDRASPCEQSTSHFLFTPGAMRVCGNPSPSATVKMIWLSPSERSRDSASILRSSAVVSKSARERWSTLPWA